MSHDPPLVVHPRSPAEAAAWQARLGSGGVCIGGGTALQLGWGVPSEGGGPPAGLTLIDLTQGGAVTGVSELQRADGRWLRLGAATRLEALRTDPRLQREAPVLVEALRTLAAPGVRQLATLGGNLGWRWGDTLAPLLAAQAAVERADGAWQSLAEALQAPVLPLIVAVGWPLAEASEPPDRPGAWRYEKFAGRAAFAPTQLAMALHLRPAATPGGAATLRLGATAAGWRARRLAAVEAWWADGGAAALAAQPEAPLGLLTGLRTACAAAGLAPAAVRLAARWIHGQLRGLHRAGATAGVTTGPVARVAPVASTPGAGLHGLAALLARATPRPDASDKLRGAAGYLSDRRPAGALHGAILGSPLPHARLVSIDVTAARALPGVHAVITAADVPGVARYGLRHVDRPVLCDGVVRCVGDPIAAVAAETPEQARAALAAIRLELAPLPPVLDAEAALAPGAPALHPGGNLLHRTRHRRGDLAAAASACAHVVEAVYETPRQMHVCLETEGGTAEPDGAGGLALYFGCQNPERDRQVIAAMLALPPERVRVVGSPVGGSYGAKDELTVQPVAALLAWTCGRPVRLQLSRPASTDLGVKRHAMRLRLRSGCDADGRLRFQEAELLADTGAYATHGPEVLDAAQEHVVGPYAWDAVAIDGRLAYTNNGIAGAFRGFGATQAQFALEQQIDRLARACGQDPLDFRRRNLAAPDAPGPLGQVVVPFDGPQRVLEAMARHPRAADAAARAVQVDAEGRWRRATGLALIHRSDGYGRGGPNGARLALALGADGRHEVRVSLTEMGQNLVATVTALAATAFGCDPTEVRAVIGDSALAPDTGAAAASRSTTLLHRALRAHGAAWLAQLDGLAAAALGAPVATLQRVPGGWAAANGRRLDRAGLAAALGDARPVRTLALSAEETPSPVDGAHYVFGACGAYAQVAVDTWTGQLRVEAMALVSALGPVVSPMGYLGQLEGGALMGQGLATTERLDLHDGRYAVRNLDGYLVPTLADAPRWDVQALEGLLPGDPIGPRGAGEISVNVAAPAIAQAVGVAIGMPVVRLPIAPDDVLDFLEAAR